MQNLYATSDLAIGAYAALFFPVEAIDRSDPRRVQFCFLRSEELDRALEEYWNGVARVPPRAYFASVRDLKHRLYDQPCN
ncbi:MAG: Uncharacterized protein Greene041662_1012 [Candidatus Peregrinibacteria bacterium Greene0416_62]|nr:MAG: Uncharacterized protein Greene041662_1012 [Candidatus Peregrinibacteria bacterium Greene0416_62]